MDAGDHLIERLGDLRLVAVMRRFPAAVLERVVPALWEAGVGAFEITMEGESAERQLTWLKQYDPRILVGAGTILDTSTMDRAASLHPDFMVSPHFDPVLVERAKEHGPLYWPGVMTPSEVAAAMHMGLHHLKLFPASTVGPRHIRELSGPFPGIVWMPTGGITQDSLAGFLEAGALACGVGSQLVPRQLVEAEDWSGITRHARGFVEAARGMAAAR